VLGRPLHLLIPEAKDVFAELLPQFGKRIACSKAFEMLHEPGCAISFPPSYGTSSRPDCADKVPLGLVQITQGNRQPIRVATVDVNGNDSTKALTYPPDKWTHRPGQRIATILRGNPFVVDRSYAIATPARRVCDENGGTRGYFWSGYVHWGETVAARGESDPNDEVLLSLEPSIAPIAKWHWRSNGLVLQLSRVAYCGINEDSDGELIAAKEVIYKGRVLSGKGMLVCGPPFQTHVMRTMAGVALSFRLSGKVVAETLIKIPQRPLIVCGDRVLGKKDIARHEFPPAASEMLLVIGDSAASPPEFTGGTSRRINSASLPTELIAYEWKVDTSRGLPRFKWDAFEWDGPASHPTLRIEASREVLGDGLRMQGTGDLWPVALELADDVKFSVHGAQRSAGIHIVFQYSSVTVRKPIESDQQIALRDLLAGLPERTRSDLLGLCTVFLQRHRERFPESCGLFFAPAEIHHSPVSVGSRPRVSLFSKSSAQMSLSAAEPASRDQRTVFATVEYPDRRDLAPGSALTLFWTADVYEIGLRDRAGNEIAVTAGADSFIALELLDGARLRVCGERSKWSLHTTGAGEIWDVSLERAMEPGGLLDDLIVNLKRMELPPASDCIVCIIAAYSGIEAGRWKIETHPVLHNFETLVRVDKLVVNLDWSGIGKGRIDLALIDDAQTLGLVSEVFPILGTSIFHRGASLSFIIDQEMFAGTPPEVMLETQIDGTNVDKRKVQLLERLLQPEDIPSAIRRLLTRGIPPNFASHACRQVLVLYFQYIAKMGIEPPNADRYAAVVESQFKNVDIAGAVVDAIKALQVLRNAPTVVPSMRPPVSHEASEFGFTLNSIVLEVLVREAELGTLNPTSLRALNAAISVQIAVLGGGNPLGDRFRVLINRVKSRPLSGSIDRR
jgi:hypothetical protein